MKYSIKPRNFKNKEGIELFRELLIKTGGVKVRTSRWSWSSEIILITYDAELKSFYIEDFTPTNDEDCNVSYQMGYICNTATPNGLNFDWRVAIWNAETKAYEYKKLHVIIWNKTNEKIIDTCSVSECDSNVFDRRFGFRATRLREDDTIPDVNPWQKKFIDDTVYRFTTRGGGYYGNYYNREVINVHPSKYMLIMYPFLETMHKIGFRAATDFLFIREGTSFQNSRYDGNTNVDSYAHEEAVRYGCTHRIYISDIDMIFKPGNTPKEILGVQDKRFIELLKNVSDHSKLINYLILIRNGESYDNMVGIIDMDMTASDLENFAWVMTQEFQGEKVFRTSQNLINYLRRIDMNEAIGAHDGLSILKDYLTMAIPCGIDPRIDSDSLKREHDVTARIYKSHKNEMVSQRIESRYQCLKKHTYKNEHFIIRPIMSHDDLIKEATMQHNCVASYAERIANGSTEIYVMRKADSPDQSLITIEFCHGEVTQKFYSHNRRVDNSEHLAFINKWAMKRIEDALKY